MPETQHKTELDLLRVVACLGVIYNHVAGSSMRLFEGLAGAAALWGFFLSKTAVPLFLMISGTVLLNRCDPPRKHLLRIGRLLAVLVLFSLLYEAVDCIVQQSAFNPAVWVTRWIGAGATNSYWYLYLYLGILLMLPLLQRLAGSMTEGNYRYALVWSLGVCGVWPLLTMLWPVLKPHPYFAVPLFAFSIGLPLCGRWLSQREGKAKKGAVVAAGVAVVLGPLILALASWRNPQRFEQYDNYFLLPVTAAACGVYYLAYAWCRSRAFAPRCRSVWTKLGRLTFGIYLLSDLLIEQMEPIRAAMGKMLPQNTAGLLFVGIVFCTGAAITYFLTWIPGLKKLI